MTPLTTDPTPDWAPRWSPDGNQIVLYAYRSGNRDVWVMASTGGEPTAVTDGFTNVWSPDWSADGSKLLYVSNQGGTMDLWQQRIGQDSKPEGEPEPVTSGLELRSAAFSPDGGKLAYTRGRWMTNVWRIPILPDRPATRTDAQQITFDNAFIQFLDLSPDGTRLVLSSDRAGNQDLWTLPSEGGVMTPLTTDPTPDWNPRWSPDGNEIVFYAYRSGNRDVWIMPADGGPARQITSDPGADISPAWTSDSSQITFNSWRRGNRDIWIVNAEGGEPRPFTTDPASDVTGDWSPDGEWFVFESSRTGENRLWIASAAGDEIHQLSQGRAHPLSELNTFSPRWSADSKIVFARHPENNIWAHMLEEHAERRVTDLVGRRGSLEAAMATDGSWIYFAWREDLGDIWVMDVVQGE